MVDALSLIHPYRYKWYIGNFYISKFGLEVVRTKGSHHFLQHPDGMCTVVPVHRGENIGRGLLAQIL
jgi:hypothetical protein